MIPGRALHRLAAHLCCAKTLERVVEPAIADLQKEYAAADGAAGRMWNLLAGYFAILKVMAICVGSVSVETKDERRALVSTLAWSAAMVAVILVMLMVPPLIDHSGMGWRAATTLVPQAMVLAVPIGIAFGMAFGLSARPTLNLAKATLGGALAASALSFVILAWAVPISFHLRFPLAAATLALVSVLLAMPVRHRGLRGALAFGACVTYWVLMFAGEIGTRRGYLTQPLGAWLPNLVLIASAIFIASSRSSRRGSLSGVH